MSCIPQAQRERIVVRLETADTQTRGAADQALRYQFETEGLATTPPPNLQVGTRPVTRVAVIGAGAMGSGPYVYPSDRTNW